MHIELAAVYSNGRRGLEKDWELVVMDIDMESPKSSFGNCISGFFSALSTPASSLSTVTWTSTNGLPLAGFDFSPPTFSFDNEIPPNPLSRPEHRSFFDCFGVSAGCVVPVAHAGLTHGLGAPIDWSGWDTTAEHQGHKCSSLSTWKKWSGRFVPYSSPTPPFFLGTCSLVYRFPSQAGRLFL